MQTNCPHCGTRLKLKAAPTPGRRVRCSSCDATFEPTPEIDDGDRPVPIDEDQPPFVVSEPPRRDRPKPAKSSNAGLIVALLGGGGLLLALLCAGVAFWVVPRALQATREAAQRVAEKQQEMQRELERQVEEEARREAEARRAREPRVDPPSEAVAGKRPPSATTKPSTAKKPKTVPERPPVVVPPPPPSEFDKALAELRSDADSTRHWGAQKLKKLPVDADRRREVADLLVASLAQEGTFAPNSAAEALAAWGDASSVEPLIACLQTTKNGNLKKTILRTLQTLDDDRCVPALIAELETEDNFYRGDVMRTLAALGDPRAIAPIAQRLPNFFARRSVKESLVAFGSVAETEVARHVAHEDRGARETAVEILQEIGTAKSLPALRKAGGIRGMEKKVEAAVAAIQARK